MALIGKTALSGDKQTMLETPFSMLARITFSDPNTFVRIASRGKNSQLGTCFNAAA